jgi:cytidylate kinase
MSVITISRGSFSGGKMLAECLSQSLGYRCIDRDVIVQRAACREVSAQELQDAFEKPPSFFDRFQHKRYLYLVLIQAALTEEVRTGKAVYHGNAGHLLLKGAPNILRVRIIAPLEFRLKMAQARLKLGREAALEYIRKVDQERKKWTQYLYGVDWADPRLYDIVVNLELVETSEACDIVSTLARQKSFAFEPWCEAAMNDLTLASQVRAQLALADATAHLEVEAVSRGGVVAIRGKVSNMREIDDVRRIAAGVPGVAGLNLDALVSPVSA